MIDKITKKIKFWLAKQAFQPGLLGMFVNPFYFTRHGLIESLCDLSKHIEGKTLDVGCGSKPYKDIFHSKEYLGIEIDSPQNREKKKADYFYGGRIFPFSEGEFDSVVTNEVLEHVFEPDIFLCEINRVLKNQAFLLITVPFIWDEHEQPFDYARYSSFGLKYLLNKYGFEIVEERKSVNDIRAIFQLLNLYIYKKTATNNQYINVIITILLISPFNLLGELFAKILPKNDDLYLNNIVLAKKCKSVSI